MKKPLSVLVTAGDTYEPIDDVRRVTHMATGRLGSLIADEFARGGAAVTLVCGERSMRPALPMAQVVEITGVLSLEAAMRRLLAETRFDAVIHSMAVSDYTVRGLAVEDDIVRALRAAAAEDPALNAAAIGEALDRAMADTSGKISSEYESIAVFMDRAPKVISCVKQMQPNTILVGFKLLSHVSEPELVEAAQSQIRASGSDFVLANDLAGIEGDRHGGLLVGPSGVLERIATKQAIAEVIARHVAQRAGE